MKVQPITIPFRQDAACLTALNKLKVSLFNALSFCLFFLLHGVFRYRFDIIAKNLKQCFPEYSYQEQQALIKSYYHHMADLIVEPFLISSLGSESIGTFVKYENKTVLNHLWRSGKDIVLLGAHYGNWEYLFSLPLFTDYEVFAVYSPLSSQFMDKKMRKLRSQYGVKLVAKQDWCRYILQRKSDKPAIFIMIADQRPALSCKYALRFFGQKTYVQAGMAKISRNLGCALVYLDTRQTARHCYKYRFELLSENAGIESDEWILDQYYSALERSILRKPELWLWSHDRWKNHDEQVPNVSFSNLTGSIVV